MKINVASAFLALIALIVGWIVLLSYLVGDWLPFLGAARGWLTAWAALLAATAVIIGVLNLMHVHLDKIASMTPDWLYSFFLFIGGITAIGVGLVPPLLHMGAATTNTAAVFIFRYVIVAGGAAISSLLVFILVLSGYRLLRRRPTLLTVVFITTAVITLLGMLPPVGGFDWGWHGVWEWLAHTPALAGSRGLLIGVALGIIATGLRVILAADRPYGE